MCAKMYTRERSGVEKTGTQELIFKCTVCDKPTYIQTASLIHNFMYRLKSCVALE